MLLNVKNKNIVEKLKKLDETGDFKKYPNLLLKSNCIVKVNSDDYLYNDEFIVISPYLNLPRAIYLYGKKGRTAIEENIYFNYWMDVFLKTIESGNISYSNFNKITSKYELAIGLPFNFRKEAYQTTWNRNNVIEFLSCLFDIKLEEAEYQQQDMFEIMAA